MTNNTDKPVRRALLTTILLILIVVLAWHLLLPMLGIAVAITAAAWGLIVASVVVFGILAMLFVVFPSVLIVIGCIIGFVWVVVSLVLFPFMFPLLVPLFILLLFMGYLLGRRKNK